MRSVTAKVLKVMSTDSMQIIVTCAVCAKIVIAEPPIILHLGLTLAGNQAVQLSEVIFIFSKFNSMKF